MVYFIQLRGRRGPIKIGYTRDEANLRKRFETIQAHSPYPARIIGVIEGAGPGVERNLHRALAPHRIRGEWYRANERVLEVVSAGHLTESAIQADPAYRKLREADQRWRQINH